MEPFRRIYLKPDKNKPNKQAQPPAARRYGAKIKKRKIL
jgi:hypothetical protein